MWEHNLQRWRDEFLNTFDDRQTNGCAEGVTYERKVMNSRSSGFTDRERDRRPNPG